MQIGMLWFDNSPVDSLAVKVRRAAQYYRDKYGNAPNTCWVHPSTQPTESAVDGIAVKFYKAILPNYLWLGVDVCAQTEAGNGQD